MNRYAEVVFSLPLARSFTYLLPAGTEDRARVGVRVLAPFGPRTLTGFIVQLGDRPPDEAGEVREIRALLDEEELIPPRMLEFTCLLSRRYASSWGEFLAAAVPPSYRPRARSRFRLTPEGGSAAGEGRLAGEEKRLAELLRGARYSARFLKKELGENSAPVLSRMRARGLVEEVEPGAPKRGKKKPASARVAQGQLALDFPPPAGLEKVFDEILHPAGRGSSGLFYFLGGRGSRESVYEALIRAVWKDSGRVLLLAPEISRAVDFLKKYEGLFAGSAAALHSRLTERQREEQWALIRSGRARLVAGTRSALFVPVPGLRVVVVEEEQDDSYFQAESPAYDARQAARVLGRVMGAAVVFGSGHPSVESYHEAEAAGRVVRLRGETPPSKARLVDVRRERGFLSRDLTEAIGVHAARGERMIVFLNRRGFASEVVCGRCGALPRCGRCDIPLFFLKRRNALVCRYCGMSRPEPGRCPVCGGPLRLGRSPGVEAVQEEIKRLFPRLRIAAFDSDSVRQESAQDLVLDRFERGRVNLLVGTQLLASRDRVPPASLVAVLNPESLLGIPDYRSGQRTYHSLCRMMRFAQGPGSEVLVQTAVPDHHALTAAVRGDFEAFYGAEIAFRRMMRYPPYSHLAEVVFEGGDIRRLARQAREFSEGVRRAGQEGEVQGPSRALGPIRTKGSQRLVVLVRSPRREDLLKILAPPLKAARSVRSVQLLP